MSRVGGRKRRSVNGRMSSVDNSGTNFRFDFDQFFDLAKRFSPLIECDERRRTRLPLTQNRQTETDMFLKNALTALLIGSLMAGGAAAAKDLRVASNTTFPPFEFVNTQTQEITGFEMDLIREMGKRAGYDVKIMNMGFDGIIPAVLSGSVDVGASGFSVTEERKKRVLFLDSFYKSGLTVLINKKDEGKIKGFADLKGKKLAVQIGTTAAQKAKEIEDAKITTFNNAGEAILELGMGGADAVINDKPVTSYILTQQPKLAAKTVHLPELLSADDFAMLVKKDNKALADELNAALKAMQADGAYKALYKKWFGDAL